MQVESKIIVELCQKMLTLLKGGKFALKDLVLIDTFFTKIHEITENAISEISQRQSKDLVKTKENNIESTNPSTKVDGL